MNAAGSRCMGAALNILTVDDERSITESMRFIFAGAEYDVTGVETANDALAKIDADPERYDVVIIDHKMPRVTGVDLVYEIRKRPYAGKIMVLSAHLSADVRMAFEELDVDVMIEKPFDIKHLRVMLDQLAA